MLLINETADKRVRDNIESVGKMGVRRVGVRTNEIDLYMELQSFQLYPFGFEHFMSIDSVCVCVYGNDTCISHRKRCFVHSCRCIIFLPSTRWEQYFRNCNLYLVAVAVAVRRQYRKSKVVCRVQGRKQLQQQQQRKKLYLNHLRIMSIFIPYVLLKKLYRDDVKVSITFYMFFFFVACIFYAFFFFIFVAVVVVVAVVVSYFAVIKSIT